MLHRRGLIEVGVTFSFLTSVLILPLTDVYTILHTAPLMITASGVFFFKERVGLREWLTVITGFLGVLIVVWPDKIGLEIGYFLPFFATVMIVIREVYTKRLPHHYSGLEIVFFYSPNFDCSSRDGFSSFLEDSSLVHPHTHLWCLRGSKC